MIQSLRQEAREARHFGQYQLLNLLGKGGMGEVYMAEHQLLKRPCAIKLIRPQHAGNPEALKRFEREVRTTASLTHWNTIEIYDYGKTDDGAFYYVMEYLPGMNLSECVKRAGPFSAARTVHVLVQICNALAEAHSREFVHRDINLRNIFLTHRGGVFDVAKLLDFGLVKSGVSREETDLTATGQVSGTPKYMSPEQASATARPGPASDLYSLGAVAYTLLAGRAPFDNSSAVQTMIAHISEPVPEFTKWNVDVPSDLNTVVMRLLAKKPEDRFTDAKALRDALIRCDVGEPWSQADAKSWWARTGKFEDGQFIGNENGDTMPAAAQEHA